MTAPMAFSEAELRAIKRAFRTRKATPEEVCLLVPLSQGFGHRMFQKLWFAAFLLGPACVNYRRIAHAEPAAQALLYPTWWAAFLLVLAVYLFVFWELPRLGMPRFEVIIRPGAKTILRRGFGFERELPATICSFATDRDNSSYLKIASDIYRICRRWWQPPFAMHRAATAALDRALAPGRFVGGHVFDPNEAQDEASRAVSKHHWGAIFSEWFFTENEMVFLLPAPNWHFFFGIILSCGAAFAASIWNGYHFPDVEKDVEVIARHLHESPLWLASVLVLAYAAIADSMGDPGMRRALAIIPKGQRSIVIRLGKRIAGEFPILDSTFKEGCSGAYDIYEPSADLRIETPVWSGVEGTGFREAGRVSAAIAAIRAYAGLPDAPRINLHG